MVITDFDICGVCTGPVEANPPLIVDADGILSLAISLESFETVSGRDGQIRECDGFIHLNDLAEGGSRDRAVDPALPGFVKVLGFAILERENHNGGTKDEGEERWRAIHPRTEGIRRSIGGENLISGVGPRI
jgi:hypothetical protein